MTKQTFKSIPKEKKYRDRYLLDMARDRSCLFRLPGICNGRTDTTVACHGNWSEMGKGERIKAHDYFTVWGCSECHTWLDFGSASEEEKKEAFNKAHEKQVEFWVSIAKDPFYKQTEREHARLAVQAFKQWVLENEERFEQGDWQLQYLVCGESQ